MRFCDFSGNVGPGSIAGSSASDDETSESGPAEVEYSEAESECSAVVKYWLPLSRWALARVDFLEGRGIVSVHLGLVRWASYLIWIL